MRSRIFVALAFVLLAVCLNVSVLATTRDSGDEVRSPLEVIGAFAYHIDHGNFGKACGLYADEYRGPVETCSQGFVMNGGGQMAMMGVDPFDACRVVPGSGKQIDDETWTFNIVTAAGIEVTATLSLRASGRWRITDIS